MAPGSDGVSITVFDAHDGILSQGSDVAKPGRV
jgi:hypothetical protein